MTTFSGTRGLPVMTKSSAEQIGEIKHFVVENGRVHAFHVEGGKKHGQLVSWSDVSALGDDAVVVESAEVLREATDDRESRALRGELVLLGKRVLDDVGDDLGQVADVVFDPSDGRIDSVLVAGEAIAGERLRGVGSYAVVVAALGEP